MLASTGDRAKIRKCSSEQMDLWFILGNASADDGTGIQQCTSKEVGRPC